MIRLNIRKGGTAVNVSIIFIIVIIVIITTVGIVMIITTTIIIIMIVKITIAGVVDVAKRRSRIFPEKGILAFQAT